MRFALVTTTINVPDVLRRYRELGPEVPFIIAGDRKSPHADINALADEMGNTTYLHPDEPQNGLSEAIGFDSIQRRNLAILEAARLDVDVIVSVDDDNEPTGDYFAELEESFAKQPRNLAKGRWFNLGALATESYTYRGFPYSEQNDNQLNGVVTPTVGIVNGAVVGDPDINATERLELDPQVYEYQPVVEDGIAMDPKTTWGPINAQNTAYRRELAPLMLQLPRVGRYDDIWGSWIAQAVLSATDWCVLYGEPFVVQDRNPQDTFQNLEDEVFGMRHTERFVAALEDVDVDFGATVRENLGLVLTSLHDTGLDLPFDFFKEWLAAWD